MQLRTLSLAVAIAPLALSGCGVLVGNVKPVTERASDYRVMDPAREIAADWEKLPPAPKNPDDPRAPSDSSDAAWQSKATASILSINSSCRPNLGGDLQSFTRELLLGINETGPREQQDVKLDGAPALRTTVEGRLQNEPIRLRSVVSRRGDCVYDLMYIARPQHFSAKEGDFEKFVGSFHAR